MEKSALQRVLEEEFGDDVRSYSGRGMYGKTCLAVDLNDSSLGHMMAVIVAAAYDEDREELAETVEGLRTDSMGRGTIAYFPNVLWAVDSDLEDAVEESNAIANAEFEVKS